MNLKALAICLSIFMVGCSQSVPVTPHEIVRVDPSWPDPIKTWQGKWQVKMIDGIAFVGMPYNESQDFRVWLNDVNRYIKDANGVICYYRAPLKEPRCEK
ncbi:Rz-like spanin [Serratia phage CHI14]|uniref:Outer membrane lipoprotein n=2 Tax=Winklervirus chi14 TaxID=2560752 RepID=A0A1Z1LYL9_9CAUD|nr:Rz-like spanin [Serratia phage CHI14]ARW57648.1 outer membrane lipoprotein [Serratia phage CHI14]ARW57923.1 outer membrane lipoprotein [Serratia phage CBH8]